MLLTYVIANAEPTTPQKMEVDPCKVEWQKLPDPIAMETDYSVGLHTNHFDVNGDGTIDLSVIFQITYTNELGLVYDLNQTPLFITVGKLMGVFHESQEATHCRVYGGDGRVGDLRPGE